MEQIGNRNGLPRLPRTLIMLFQYISGWKRRLGYSNTKIYLNLDLPLATNREQVSQVDTANRKLDLIIILVFSCRSRIGLSPRTLLRGLILVRM